VFLGGCSGGQNLTSGEDAGPTRSQPAIAISSAAASPRPKLEHKAGDVNGRAQNVPLRIRAELTDENTKEGLEEYTKYRFSLLSYGFETGDVAAWSKQTSPSCVFCNALKKSIAAGYQKGGWLVGGHLSTPSVQSNFKVGASRQQVVTAGRRSSHPGRDHLLQGRQICWSKSCHRKHTAAVVLATYARGKWSISDMHPLR
jgi:hypothetical protein